MDVGTFYKALWKAKEAEGYVGSVPRSWLHRHVLDPIFDPTANPRHEIAARLLPPGNTLLDIGAGKGRLLEAVRKNGSYRELHAVEVLDEAVRFLQDQGFHARLADLNQDPLPYPDSFFDGISILGVIEHIFDPYHVIREIRRVLRPGGHLVIDVPNVASFTNRLRILSGRLPVTSCDAGWDGGHLHYFTRKDLDRFLQREGFQVLVRETTGGRPRLRNWWLSLLAGELIYLCRRT